MTWNVYDGLNRFAFRGREQLTHEIHSNEHDFLFNVVRTRNNNRLCAVVLWWRSVLSSVLVLVSATETMNVSPPRGTGFVPRFPRARGPMSF